MKRESTIYKGVYKRGNTYSYRIRDQFGDTVEKGGFKTPAQAFKAKNDALAEKRKGTYTRGTLTALELCQRYLEATKRQMTKDSWSNVDIAVKKYIGPILGHVKLGVLQDSHIYRLMNKVAEQTSEKRANTIRSFLAIILNFGVEGRHLTFNPTKSVKPFKVAAPKIDVLTLGELNRLLSVCDEFYTMRDKVIVGLAGYLGLRRGEVFGLHWGDIDIQEGAIRIERQLSKGKEREPKTENAIRELPIPLPLRDMLKEFAKESFKKGRRDYLFVNYRGERLGAEKWCKWKFHQIVEKAGITDKKITFHRLRDSYATINVEAGTDPGILSKLMGHYSTAFTYDKYVRPSIEQKKKSIQNFENLLGNCIANGE